MVPSNVSAFSPFFFGEVFSLVCSSLFRTPPGKYFCCSGVPGSYLAKGRTPWNPPFSLPGSPPPPPPPPIPNGPWARLSITGCPFQTSPHPCRRPLLKPTFCFGHCVPFFPGSHFFGFPFGTQNMVPTGFFLGFLVKSLGPGGAHGSPGRYFPPLHWFGILKGTRKFNLQSPILGGTFSPQTPFVYAPLDTHRADTPTKFLAPWVGTQPRNIFPLLEFSQKRLGGFAKC